MRMAHSFCRRLTNSYRFNQVNGKLHYQPCCWVLHNSPITDQQSLINARHKITSEVESNTSKNCHECLQREKTNFRKSGRLETLDYIPEDAEPGVAYTLEFQLDTTCNAACAMCGPHFSSLWQKQNNITLLEDSTIQQMHVQAMSMIDIDKVTLIRFLGGEPLLTRSHIDIIKLVPNPSTVTLIYVTNGSIFPSNEVLELWSKFKRIVIAVSIDGIDEQFSYIRWPLKWERVSENFLDIAQALPNINMSINYTVNPMNAGYVGEFEEWVKTTEQSANIKIIKTFSPCYGAWATSNMPQSLFDKLLTMYPSDHSVIGIINSFPPSGKHSVLVNNMNTLDTVRKLDWQQTFSKVAHHFK